MKGRMYMTTPNENAIAKAIKATLISPNEADSNLEAANVVDGLFFLARHIRNGLLWTGAGESKDSLGEAMEHASARIAAALNNVAEAIREGNKEPTP